MATLGFLIGRFQVFHKAHLFLVQEALLGSKSHPRCDRLLILIGSSCRARSVKNPFSFDERKDMMQRALYQEAPELIDRVIFAPVEDQMYDEPQWVVCVHAEIQKVLQQGETPVLIGHEKDASSDYLKLFPEYVRAEYPHIPEINATEIREAWLSQTLENSRICAWIPRSIYEDLRSFEKDLTYLLLKTEFEFLKQYRDAWAQSPYPPIFVTVDALVLCNEHVLLIQRGHQPGIGLWAMPGGFLEPQEWVYRGIIRELKEETQLELSITVLTALLREVRVFDHPDRAQVGRAITHVGRFELPYLTLPKVKAHDDAQSASWIPIASLPMFSKLMHDDHYYILKKLLGFKSLDER